MGFSIYVYQTFQFNLEFNVLKKQFYAILNKIFYILYYQQKSTKNVFQINP